MTDPHGPPSNADAGSDADVDEITLTLPALVPYARVARLAITGLASRNGFSYDEVEDLRIAIGEVFGVLVESLPAVERLRFTCRIHPDALEVDAQRDPAHAIDEVSDLTEQILAAVVHEATIDTEAGRVRIVKRLEPGR